jgi:signal transduction histidine kinase
MSLRTRLILSYVLIIVLCLSVVAAALLVLLQDYRDRLAVARLSDMSLPVYVQVRPTALGRISLNQAWTNLEELAQETNTYIFLLDTQGNVIKYASPEESSSVYDLPKPPPEKLPANRKRPYRGTYVSSEGQNFMFVAHPFTGLFKSRSPTAPATLVLAVPRTEAPALWTELAKPFLWAGLIALGVSIVIAILLARSVYLPIRRVTNAAEEMAQGQYDQEVPLAGPKEVRGLALRFNQMAKQVKYSQQMLRNFVADVSHELRTPLTSIKGFSQAILDGTARDKEAQLKAARVIEDESKRMMRLVDELLELSKLESGQVNMVKEPTDLKELLQQCREIFMMRAEEKGLQFTTDVEPLPPVNGDIDRLEQVFSNLLDNAFKHTPAGGKVSIAARQPSPNFVEVIVLDTGPGIPPDQLPHVFERFYRADASGTKTGTGLGLAIAREIARAHGGDIKVNSVPGEGTEFLVRLPVNPTVGDHPTM